MFTFLKTNAQVGVQPPPAINPIVYGNDLNTINLTPKGILENVLDNRGTKFKLKDLLIKSPSGILTNSLNCSSTSYFNLYFEAGSGMEIMTNPIHAQRRAVVCKFFEDLSSFIISPLSNPSNITKVNIWVRNINNVFSNPNGILGLASSYYCLPHSTVTGGIADNEIWKTINTGADSYLNLTVPITNLRAGTNQIGLFYHGMITFNFNDTAIPAIPNTNPIVWNTDLATNSIPINVFDLYTAVLHEVTHALGFSSLIAPDGTSKLGYSYDYFNRYDKFLKTNDSNNFLLTTSASSNMYNNKFNQNLLPAVLHPNPFGLSCIE
ncbi:MAG: hypothetical protein H7174_08840, partial [Flavobacterium sp.]|nr:hypothetical protein [Flavobacterium sp.]